MNWLKKLLGIKSKEERQRQKAKDLLQKSFEAQRAGDMEMAGVYQKQADEIMDDFYNSSIPPLKEEE
jgi:3-hydroxyacyl-CoA dehydrogenase